MRLATSYRSPCLALLGLSLVSLAISQGASPEEAQGAERPFGIERRVPWTTSRIKGTPDPPLPYRTEPAFPKLKFAEPLAMAHAPGSDRVFVAQRYGKLSRSPTTRMWKKRSWSSTSRDISSG